MYASSRFSFKANCPSDFDCAPPALVCPPDDTVPPPIDYLAKDFQSFRSALMDFSALRYPAWVERSEADFGMMFAEALSAVADDLSYLQDRVAAEATLETATQRRSLTSLARLVDYEPRPATSATTLLQLDVAGPGVVASRRARLRPLAGRRSNSVRSRDRSRRYDRLLGLGPLELQYRAVLVRRSRSVLARRRNGAVGPERRFRLHRRPGAPHSDRFAGRQPTPAGASDHGRRGGRLRDHRPPVRQYSRHPNPLARRGGAGPRHRSDPHHAGRQSCPGDAGGSGQRGLRHRFAAARPHRISSSRLPAGVPTETKPNPIGSIAIHSARLPWPGSRVPIRPSRQRPN